MSGTGPGGGTGDPSGAGPDEVLATDGSPGGLTALGPSAPETIDFAGPLDPSRRGVEPAPVGAAAVAESGGGPGAGSLDRQAICGEVGYGAGRFRQPGNETAATLATEEQSPRPGPMRAHRRWWVLTPALPRHHGFSRVCSGMHHSAVRRTARLRGERRLGPGRSQRHFSRNPGAGTGAGGEGRCCRFAGAETVAHNLSYNTL